MKRVVIWMVAIGFLFGSAVLANAATYKWMTFDYPNASYTYPQDIYGDKIVGYAVDSWSNGYSFVYDYKQKTWTTLDSDYNSDNAPDIWEADGISGNVIVGRSYFYKGFSYDLETKVWKDIGYPGDNVDQTWARGIDGDNIVGWWDDYNHYYSFLYNNNNGNYTTLSINNNFIKDIQANDISGNYIVGTLYDYAFLYDLSDSSLTVLYYLNSGNTIFAGIDGSKVVGYYDTDPYDGVPWHGLIYDIQTGEWQTVDYPAASATEIEGIYGSTIVGTYWDGNGHHGFVASPVPLPPSLLLLGSGVLGLLGFRRKKGNLAS